MYVYTYIYTYVYTYVHIYMRMYVYIYTHTHTYILTYMTNEYVYIVLQALQGKRSKEPMLLGPPSVSAVLIALIGPHRALTEP